MPLIQTNKRLNLKYRGMYAHEITYKCRLARPAIRDFCQQMSDTLARRGKAGQMSVALFFPTIGWRSGYLTNYGDPIKLYASTDSEGNLSDPKHFKSFVIYLIEKRSSKGGRDPHNDCLFYVLKRATLHDLPWTFPASFKNFLGVARDDMIDIKHMPAIEQKLKYYKINVDGDYTYQSTKADAKLEINLLLKDEHYTLNTTHMQKLHGVAYEEKIPMLYITLPEGKKKLFDGETERIVNNEEFEELRKNPITNTHIYIDIQPKNKNAVDIQQEYERFMKEANGIKEDTEGLINCFKTGGRVNTALKLFYYFTQSVNPEPILDDEARWIHYASQSAIMYAEPYAGPAYKYDFCSMYPSSLARQSNMFPIKRGEFLRLTEEEFNNPAPPKFGIYRCIIEENEKPEIQKLFRYNNHNYYAVKDVITARRLNLKVSLIQDDQPNFLYYSTEKCLTGSQLFKEFVDTVFPLKQKYKLGKQILNCLWGALCQMNRKHHKMGTADAYEVRDDCVIDSLTPYDDENIMITYHEQNNLYANRYARIEPFVLSNGRYLLYSTMKDHHEKLVYVHTDGVICDRKLDIKTGDKLGDLKFEGFRHDCVIKNITKKNF